MKSVKKVNLETIIEVIGQLRLSLVLFIMLVVVDVIIIRKIWSIDILYTLQALGIINGIWLTAISLMKPNVPKEKIRAVKSVPEEKIIANWIPPAEFKAA